MTNQKKVALITGAAHRLGKNIAIELHSRNINVAIHCGKSINAARLLCEQLNDERSQSATLLSLDLTAPRSANSLIKQTTEHFNRLDYLVNNASIFYPTPIMQTQESHLNSFLTINCFQPVKLIQSALSQLKSNRGAVVNLIDIYAQRGLSEHCDYVASKNALLEATKELAIRFAPEIRINAVSPGAILWPDNAENDLLIENQSRKNIINNTALKRQGCAKDISQTVAHLLIDATYTTGSLINVDGGRNLYI